VRLETRHIVTNQQNQPIELHLTWGVVVLEAGASAEVRESDLAHPQLQVLQRNKFITTRPTAEALSSPEQDSRTGARPRPAAGRRGKTKAEA
jgi:hypothetical protein